MNDDAVYFDNFTVSFTRKRIVEENHYYAFGLRIAGISSRKYDGGMEGSLKNEFLYNDKELWDDADLNWYDYGFRNYDPQIGRFTQLDPLTWDYPELTNYQYASNEPIANVDLDGLEGASAIIEEFIKQGGKPLQDIVVVGKSTAQVASTAGTFTSAIKSVVRTGLTAFTATASTLTDNILGTSYAERIANSGAIPSDQINNWNTAVKTTNEASIAFGLGEMFLGGKMMEGGGGALLLTGGASAEFSVPAIALGGAMVLHGPIVMNNASRNLATGKGTIKSDGSKYRNAGPKDSRRLTEKEIGEFLGAGEGWHKGKAKNKFLKKFEKELKGDTNADFYIDKNTNNVFLKSNRSANWIDTGKKFK